MVKKAIKENLQTSKPPVIVVMGHVDHGKTTLIDYIRKTKVAEKESGGITQGIGAYEIIHHGKKMTFIDTPGHEAFSQIRSRGAKTADIAILIVAADDGVMPQTKEAIDHIKSANIPFVVAINKIDKGNAQPEKIKKQLGEYSVFLEGYGGDISSIELSAKNGTGVKDLLDLIILISEMSEIKVNQNKNANGVILESKFDSQKGLSISVIVNDGTLTSGDYLVIGNNLWKTKFMENFLGKPIKMAPPSTPVLIYGLSGKINIGDIWTAHKTKEEAEKVSSLFTPVNIAPKIAVEKDADKKILNIILKTDVSGSLEAIESIINNFNFKKAGVRIIRSGVGDITEEDLRSSETSNARILGFKVKFLRQIKDLVNISKTKASLANIIYELIDSLKEEMTKILNSEIKRTDLGQLKVLATFGTSKEGMIIGGQVTDGVIRKSTKVEVIRQGKSLGSGKIMELKRNKEVKEEMRNGEECGLNIGSGIKIEINDILKCYTEEILPKYLE